jgi:hypothetical protein
MSTRWKSCKQKDRAFGTVHRCRACEHLPSVLCLRACAGLVHRPPIHAPQRLGTCVQAFATMSPETTCAKCRFSSPHLSPLHADGCRRCPQLRCVRVHWLTLAAGCVCAQECAWWRAGWRLVFLLPLQLQSAKRGRHLRGISSGLGFRVYADTHMNTHTHAHTHTQTHTQYELRRPHTPALPPRILAHGR